MLWSVIGVCGEDLNIDLSRKANKARVAWAWCTVPICLHSEGSGEAING